MSMDDSIKRAAGPLESQDTPSAEEFTPCPRTVRMCIEALPKISIPYPNGLQVTEVHPKARAALEALLPKPDRAEELAEEWMLRADWPDMGVYMAVVEYTRDLIERGEIKG
jgi:hypothetical protein